MDKEHIETLATAVHASLATLHSLALVHNVRRRNWRDAIVHAGFLTYDAMATYRHYKSQS